MRETEFTTEDLFGLTVCVGDLNELLVREREAATDKAVRYALVKIFELTYEIAIETLRKFMVVQSRRSDEARYFDLQDLIRLADQHGLVRHGWPEWKRYRTNRGRTVHTYGGEIALEITASLHDFAAEVNFLLEQLRTQLEQP